MKMLVQSVDLLAQADYRSLAPHELLYLEIAT
jgi:hypothetical protein